MLSTWIQAKKDEEGFTLIELLVVVIIIGILAAIAIPVFLNQRENAWRSAAESDARNAAIEVESSLTETGSYPADQAAFDALNVNNSQGVALVYAVATDGSAYSITGQHDRLTDTLDSCYRSAAGGIVKPLPATCAP